MYLTLDIGGTFIKYALVSSNANSALADILVQGSFPSRTDLGQEMAYYWLQELDRIREYRFSEFIKTDESLDAVAIGIPGSLDREQGIVIDSPNLQSLNGFNVRDFFSEHFHCHILLENDVNSYALGEFLFYKQENPSGKDIIAVALGTGVGSGLILNGELFRGQGNAGEIGHVTVDHQGEPCSCGSYGCLERYASTAAMIDWLEGKLWEYLREDIPDFHVKDVSYWLSQYGDKFKLRQALDEGMLSGERIFQGAESGDQLSIEAYERMGYYLGIGCATLANIFNPQAIIIGGAVVSGRKYFWESMIAVFQRRAMRGIAEMTEILPAFSPYSSFYGLVSLLQENTIINPK